MLFPTFYSNYKLAKESYKLDCGIEGIGEGYTLSGLYNQSNQQITINIPQEDPEYEDILMHERCHKVLHELDLIGRCEIPITVILEEFTCYMSEYLV